MKMKKVFLYLMTVIMLLSMTVGVALAEDGILFRKNISKTPDNETEKAAVFMMDFYVPAQSSDGTVKPVTDYVVAAVDDDGNPILVNGEVVEETVIDDRDYAKPLISVWIDDLTHELEAKGGISFGMFDAFVGVSLDDGTTWKSTNLSRSADLSSFILQTTGEAYPGDVHNVVHQVAGDKIFVVWASKYCDGGTPLYTLDPEVEDDATYLGILDGSIASPNPDYEFGFNPVYLTDLFSVAGSQGSVDYELQGWPEIGEIPYSCIWSARGKLIPGDDFSTNPGIADDDGYISGEEATHVVWTKPERLTSGRRDANLPAVDCAGGAGCMLTWQEDPGGLRPGQGLGPGEGWSGAIANQQTDMWYSYIGWDNFDIVFTDSTDITSAPISIEEYEVMRYADTQNILGMPKPYVPMAMPVRLTDNNMCKGVAKYDTNGDLLNPYCYYDFENFVQYEGSNTEADLCADTFSWTNPGGTTLEICTTQDGRVLNGRTASTRTRLNLKPYTKADGSKSAWVVMAYEETKAMGDMLLGDTNGDGSCQEDEPNCVDEPIDIGKDVRYHSFDMFTPDLVAQGGMLNQPAQCKYNFAEDPLCAGLAMGDFYPVQTDDLGNEFYLSEIARRFALTTNAVSTVANSSITPSGLSAMLIYKQGIINQGGPADIMLRRVLIPDGFDPAVDNPYVFENMECGVDGDGWKFTNNDNGGINVNYLQGICMASAINISGSTIAACETDAGEMSDNNLCAEKFPVEDDGSIDDDITNFPKVTEWRQLPYEATSDGDTFTDDPNDENDLDDQSWENPFDVSKGHRGFLDGDIVMMMYAWAPNWKANTVGNDHYNLYVRRSFDGGLTWTTTPADVDGDPATVEGDGTTTCEWYGLGGLNSDDAPYEVCFDYGAEALEQGRNVSQLVGNKVTVLDPRYTPTGGLKLYPEIHDDWLLAQTALGNINFTSDDALPYPDDAARDSSKFFVIYETGDNTVLEDGAATPLDLFYSRGTAYGDDYELMDYVTSDGTVKQYWPWLENQHDDLSGEASVVANPGGNFMYAVWNQWQETLLEDGHVEIHDSDIIFRRLLYNDFVELDPTASFIYLSPSMIATDTDDIATVVITAKDLDRLGDGEDITEYEWSIDGTVYAGCDSKQCNVPARTLSNGWDGFGNQAGSGGYGSHEFSVRVKDNDPNQLQPEEMGNWSNQIYTSFMVVEVIYKVQLPFLTR